MNKIAKFLSGWALMGLGLGVSFLGAGLVSLAAKQAEQAVQSKEITNANS